MGLPAGIEEITIEKFGNTVIYECNYNVKALLSHVVSLIIERKYAIGAVGRESRLGNGRTLRDQESTRLPSGSRDQGPTSCKGTLVLCFAVHNNF